MKRIAIIGFMFFMIFSYLSADENINDYENVFFSWQLFNIKKLDRDIKYVNINPLFFSFDNDLLQMNLLENSFQNNHVQKRQNANHNYQENDVYGFIGSLFAWAGYYYAHSSMNRQEREIYNNAWEQQANEEKMRQLLLRHAR